MAKILRTKKELPVSTYNNLAAVCSCLFANYEDPYQILYENALSCYFYNHELRPDSMLFFDWDCFISEYYEFDDIAKKEHDFVSFLKNKIDSNFYIYCYVNEQYIDHRYCTHKEHHFHDIFIYGYENTGLHTMGFDENMKFTSQVIHNVDMSLAISSLYEDEPHTCVCFQLNPKKLTGRILNTNIIKKEINALLNNLNFQYPRLPGSSFGLSVYDAVIQELPLFDRDDIRPCSMIRDHIKMVAALVKRLNLPRQVNDQMENLTLDAERLLILKVKNCINFSESGLDRIAKLLSKMKRTEEAVLKECFYRV